MSGPTLTDRLEDALASIEAIRAEAADRDNRVTAAEARAVEAEKAAQKSRRERDEAVSKFSSLEDQIVGAKANAAGEIESLKAQIELLASRDYEARQELDRLRMTKASA